MPSVNSQDYKDNLESLYQQYFEAEKSILSGGQEYTIGDRTLKRGDLKFIASEKKKLANELAKLEAGKGIRVQRIIPVYN